MNDPTPSEKVPLFRTWRAWYAMVLLFLAGIICVFYFITKHFQ